jgi:hypothetical protein
MESLRDKALMMTDCDNKVNGTYCNSPYTIVHDAVLYKAYIRHHMSKDNNKSEIYLEIVRPTSLVHTIPLVSSE